MKRWMIIFSIFGIFLLSLGLFVFAQDDKEKLEYIFARDNLKKIEEQSLKTYESIIEKGGKYKNQSMLDVSKYYYDKGQYDKSLEYLNKIYRGIKEEDVCAEANLIRGKIFGSYEYSGRDLNETIACFYYVINVYPNNKFVGKALLEMANLDKIEGKYGKAIKNYFEIVYKYPEFESMAEVYMNIAMSYVRLGELDSAMGWFKKLTSEFPDSEQAIISKKIINQVFKVELFPKAGVKSYQLDSSFNPDFKVQKAGTLTVIGEYTNGEIKASDMRYLYTIDPASGSINKDNLSDVVGFFDYMDDNYYILMKSGIYCNRNLSTLSVSSGSSVKTLKELVCADIDKKGIFYVVDDYVDGVHLFSHDYKYMKTFTTSLDGKIDSICIDPFIKIYLLSSSRSELLILDENGKELEKLNLKERFDIGRAIQIDMDWLGNKFILDDKNKAIFVLGSDNTLLFKFMLGENESFNVKRPESFLIDDISCLYVLDSGNNTILRFK
jgi:tetratricopeptide (TPR) repeat protein